jgi:hypothetical protein
LSVIKSPKLYLLKTVVQRIWAPFFLCSNYDECWQGFYVKYFGSVDGATLSADGSTWSQLNGQNLTTFCTPYTSGAPARVSVSLLLLVLTGAAFAALLF